MTKTVMKTIPNNHHKQPPENPMTTTITTEHERRVTVTGGLLTVLNTETGREINTSLTVDERRALADALDPDRATGGQWTRADLPDDSEAQWATFTSRFGAFDGYRSPAKQHDLWTVFKSGGQHAVGHALDHLNAHYPKPVPYDQGGWPKPGTPEQLVRMCNDADLKRVHAEDARDAAVERTARRDEEIDLIARQCAEARAARDAAVARAEAAEKRAERHASGATAANLERDQAYAEKVEQYNRAETAESELAAMAERADDLRYSRDAAVARAEAAERVLRERDEQEDDATRAACERAEALDKQAHDWADMYKVTAERAEQAESERDGWRENAEHRSTIIEQLRGRAEKAERQLRPGSPLNQQADAWMRIVAHPAISHGLREGNGSYSDQVFERITWLFEAAGDARESKPTSAVSRDPLDISIRDLLQAVVGEAKNAH